jgi:hypothetical protein
MAHLPCLQFRLEEGAASRYADHLIAPITSHGIRIRQSEYPL